MPKRAAAVDLEAAMGISLGDCLLIDGSGVLRDLESFSSSEAHPAQLIAGFTAQA